MLTCSHCRARVKWRDDICPACGRLIINDREKQSALVKGGVLLLLAAALAGGLLIRTLARH